MNFRQLCQRVARESGTVGGDLLPSTVVGQTGRLRLVVDQVADAWVAIQNVRSSWRWMQTEGMIETTTNVSAYDGSGLSRFGAWTHDQSGRDSGVTAWRTADGRAAEGALIYVSPRDFGILTRGVERTGPPSMFTENGAGELVLSPTPDDAYTIRAPYRKSPQVLAADEDAPEMPSRHHEVIWRLALERLDMHDEADLMLIARNTTLRGVWSALERDQLPRMTIG